jgi:hypothetical protein
MPLTLVAVDACEAGVDDVAVRLVALDAAGVVGDRRLARGHLPLEVGRR